jgi:hypothetical protein
MMGHQQATPVQVNEGADTVSATIHELAGASKYTVPLILSGIVVFPPSIQQS